MRIFSGRVKHVGLRSKKTILPFDHAYKQSMVGELRNEDVWVPAD
ncbi:hypothetical protein N8813_01650 [bacterium]|nr:hypothetical protein [bacterium]MDC0314424.1 hypothetical protein [bacterium]MDC0322507.1 hypothetical protein [Verrucomicrobiales bacterium]